MKKSQTLFVVLLAVCAFAYFMPATAQADSRGLLHLARTGDCVKCGMQGSCKACKSGNEGLSCITPDCNNCMVYDACSGESQLKRRSPDSDGQAAVKPGRGSGSLPLNPFKLDASLIREIAQFHPRFAATLANINTFGGFTAKVIRVHWTPVEIYAQDIDWFLNGCPRSGFFEEYTRRGQELNLQIQKGLIEDIVYELSIESLDADINIIRLSMQNDPRNITVDPPYSLLEITLSNEWADKSKSTKVVKPTWIIN